MVSDVYSINLINLNKLFKIFKQNNHDMFNIDKNAICNIITYIV